MNLLLAEISDLVTWLSNDAFVKGSVGNPGIFGTNGAHELPARVKHMRDVLLSQLKSRFRLEDAPELWLAAALCSPKKRLKFLKSDMQEKGAVVLRKLVATLTSPAESKAASPFMRRLTSTISMVAIYL